MGRLYDRQDLAWNLNFWNRREMELHADVANGLMPANILEETVTYSARGRVKGPGGQYLSDEERPSRHLKLKDAFDYERKRERFKLLKTGMLLQNLMAWKAIFKACPNCYQEKAKVGDKTYDKPCKEHIEGYTKAKSDVWWAGERNLDERNARGQRRTEDALTTKEALEGTELPTGLETLERVNDAFGRTNITTNPLNKWEALYQRDKASDNWTERDARRYEVEPDYKGWLRMLLEEEEMTEQEYLNELARLRREANELESTTKALAGTNAKPKRDSRHNRTAN
jgi:hypothetical protein